MRWSAIVLASFLVACAPAGDEGENELVESNAPAPIHSGPDATGNLNGDAATAPDGEIVLRASPEQVDATATVTLRLDNGSQGRVGYNLCTSTLQTAAGDEVRSDRICTMELRILEPGRAATYAYDLPDGLETGRYRFSTSVDQMDDGAPTTLTSNVIEVR